MFPTNDVTFPAIVLTGFRIGESARLRRCAFDCLRFLNPAKRMANAAEERTMITACDNRFITKKVGFSAFIRRT